MPRRRVVLIVDDEEICLTITSEMVKSLGFSAMTARDGREAVEIFHEHGDQIACVLMDLQMPRMDGIEAYRQLKKIDENVQVVIASGFLNDTYRKLLHPLGPAGYLNKPIRFSEISKLLLGLTSCLFP